MSVRGPGAALTWHLDLYEANKRAVALTYEDDTQIGVDRMAIRNPHFVQRSKLMSAIESIAIVDGQTVATSRDSLDAMFTEPNMVRTIVSLRQEHEVLDKAETIYVSHSVMSAVQAAAEQAEPEMLFPTDLPTKAGLIVFEEPLLLPDLSPDDGQAMDDLIMPIRAIGFSEGSVAVRTDPDGPPVPSTGVLMTLYTDEACFTGYYINTYAKHWPDRTDEMEEMYASAAVLRQWTVDQTAWAYSTPWTQVEFKPEGRTGFGEVIRSMALVRRWFLAFARWTWQRILVPDGHTPNRADRRRWSRAKGGDEPHIKVLRLRRSIERERTDHVDDEFIDQRGYSWIVRGHWRRQHYPSLGPARNEDGSFNHESHRLVWIEAHVAGEGPLKVGHQVTAAVR